MDTTPERAFILPLDDLHDDPAQTLHTPQLYARSRPHARSPPAAALKLELLILGDSGPVHVLANELRQRRPGDEAHIELPLALHAQYKRLTELEPLTCAHPCEHALQVVEGTSEMRPGYGGSSDGTGIAEGVGGPSAILYSEVSMERCTSTYLEILGKSCDRRLQERACTRSRPELVRRLDSTLHSRCRRPYTHVR